MPSLGGSFEMRDGQVELFSINPPTGEAQLVYSFHFRTDNDQVYFFRGRKVLSHDRWRFDMLKGMTHLFARIYQGMDENAPLYGTAVLKFRARDFPALIASMKCEEISAHRRNLEARAAFLSVAWSALRNEYLRGVRLFYECQYENLVLAGSIKNRNAGALTPFFFVSGVHDKNFPWGDGELFWDVLLAIKDGCGMYRRYCIADRILPGLELDVAAGSYRYRGPVFAIENSFSTSSLWMKSKAGHRAKLHAEIEVDFEPQGGDIVSFPFPAVHPWLRRMWTRMIEWTWQTLPGANPPGIHIQSQPAVIRSGSVRILRSARGETVEDFRMEAADTCGECEHGTFRSVKRPRLRYRYSCTIDPARKSTRVQITAGTFSTRRPNGGFLDGLVARIGSAEIRNEGKTGLRVMKIRPRHPESGFSRQHAPVLELNNDHYSTAILQRRIVEAEESGVRLLALEENVPGFRP